MSRAFVNEDAAAANPVEVPNRAVSDRPNLVTPDGLRLIERRLEELRLARDELGPERPGDATRKEREAVIARDLRYWAERRRTAQVMAPPAGPLDEVVFGALVTVAGPDGKERRWRLVGEDEADPAAGRLNWAAPLGQALLGAMEGDEVVFEPGRPALTILRIEA